MCDMRRTSTQQTTALPAAVLLLVLVYACIFRATMAAGTSAATNTLVLDQFTEETGSVRDVLPWHGMFQSWRPTWSGPLARIDLLMGSKTPCRRFTGTLRVEEVLAGELVEDVGTAVLLEQTVESTCASCDMTEQTCIMAGACRHTACIAWQQWHLQHAINVQANRTYLFRIRNWTPLDDDVQAVAAAAAGASYTGPPHLDGRTHPAVPSVAVAPPSANQGGRSSLPLNPRITHQMTQFTFRTLMARGPQHGQPPVFPATSTTPSFTDDVDQPSTNKDGAALSTTSIVLVVVVVLLVVAAAATGLAVRRSVNARAKVGLDTLPHTSMDDPFVDAPSKMAWPMARHSCAATSEPVSVYTHHVVAVNDEEHGDTASIVDVDALRIATDQRDDFADASDAVSRESHKPSSVAWQETPTAASRSSTHVMAPRHIDVAGLSSLPPPQPLLGPEHAFSASNTVNPDATAAGSGTRQQGMHATMATHAWGTAASSAVTRSPPRTRQLFVATSQRDTCPASPDCRGQQQAQARAPESSVQTCATAAGTRRRARRRPRVHDVVPLDEPHTPQGASMASTAQEREQRQQREEEKRRTVRDGPSPAHTGGLPGSAYAWSRQAVVQMGDDDSGECATRNNDRRSLSQGPGHQRQRPRGGVARVRRLPSTPSSSNV